MNKLIAKCGFYSKKSTHPPTKIKDAPEDVRKKATVQFVLRNTVKINHSIYFLALFTEM